MDDLARLALQLDFGADEALEQWPRDRLAPVAVGVMAAAPEPEPEPAAPNLRAIAAPSPPEAEAEALAAGAMDLEMLAARLDQFDACPLRATAMHSVLGEGPPGGLMVLADVPGEAEDRSGRAFAGAEGRLLEAMLAAIGLDRGQVRLGYAVGLRPPGSRNVTERERALCRPFLWRHLVLARPRWLLILGAAPAGMLWISEKSAPKRRRIGDWQDLPLPGTYPATRSLISLPLEQLIKKPLEKRVAWAHLRQLRREISGPLVNG